MSVDEFGNQNEFGESNDSIGQDEGETSEVNWEEQAKYFQSEKDKLYSENQSLKQYEEVGKFLESRPDIVQNIEQQIGGGQSKQQQVSLKPDEFDPWEAYNDPSSKSYQFRTQEMQGAINNAVGEATQGIKRQNGRTELTGKLQSKGLNEDQVKSFYAFADKHPSEYGLDNVLKMWQAVTTSSGTNGESPNDQVRNVQSQPQQVGGVLQGQRPLTPKSDADEMWQGIMKAEDKRSF
jgi:hypothetical protein